MAEQPARPRPRSPFLTVYKWPVTMLTSIVHRVTGVGLAAGTLLLACWLVALALGPEAYAKVQAFHAHFIGRVLLFGFSWALIYHLLNGVRHLAWDAYCHGDALRKMTEDHEANRVTFQEYVCPYVICPSLR